MKSLSSERAKNIVESYGVIEVLYKGDPVWIESVKDGNAEVTYVKTNERIEVPVEELVEDEISES